MLKHLRILLGARQHHVTLMKYIYIYIYIYIYLEKKKKEGVACESPLEVVRVALCRPQCNTANP
jgi:hypothetical protein